MAEVEVDAGKLRNVLVVRLGAIGDVLRVLPAVRRLRSFRPDLHIGWAVEDWVYPIVAGNPAVDRFHVLRRSRLSAGPRNALGEIRRYLAAVDEFRRLGCEPRWRAEAVGS